MGIASDPSDVAARSARNLKDFLQSLNMNSLLENFESDDLSLIELASLDHGDLEDLGVLDVQKRELFMRAAKKIEQRILMERSKTIGEICDVLQLVNPIRKDPGDLLACETVSDLKEHFEEVKFMGKRGNVSSVIVLERGNGASVRRFGDDDDDDIRRENLK